MATTLTIKRALAPLGRRVSVRKYPTHYGIQVTTDCGADNIEVLWHARRLLAPLHHPHSAVDVVPLQGDGNMDGREHFLFNYAIGCSAH
jgi:hypothetical protein